MVWFSGAWMVSGKRWVAAVLTCALFTGWMAIRYASPGSEIMITLILSLDSLVLIYVLMRFGVAAAVVLLQTMDLITRAPAGLDFSAWYQDAGRTIAAILALLAACSCYTALAGRRVLS